MIDQQTEHRVPRAKRRCEPESASHSTDVSDVAGKLGTDIESGLAESVARRRLAEVGANRLPAPNRPPYLAIAARQMADQLVALLLAATAVSFLIGERLEALVIASIVVLNAMLGFVQEVGAQSALCWRCARRFIPRRR